MKKEVLATFILILIVVLISFSVVLINNQIKENTDNIIIINNTIRFDSLTLKQKLAQMIVVYGDESNLGLTSLNIGGVLLDSEKSKENYQSLIKKYQENSKIKLFVTTDMEGAWNPFSKFRNFTKFSDIKTKEEAYNTGLEEGKLLRELGFNLNFAPVAEFSDDVYGGRAFFGTEQEVKDKLENYIKGLQKSINGACKHYPGKGMINNLHNEIDTQNITKEDLELFQICLQNNISAIMIGHQIVFGGLDSFGKPSSASSNVINSLENFSGLIISDEINMNSLSDFERSALNRYKELINSGENLILDFNFNLKKGFYCTYLLKHLEQLVENGEINEKKINDSVKKILIAKGYSVI